jgi:hypothetical protein
MLCALLAVLLAVTPLGSLAHPVVPGSDFRSDFCTAAVNPDAAPGSPTSPLTHPDTHAHCGDCSTCGIGLVPSAAAGIPAILIVAVPLDAVVVSAPLKSLVGGMVARPRGPPLPG